MVQQRPESESSVRAFRLAEFHSSLVLPLVDNTTTSATNTADYLFALGEIREATRALALGVEAGYFPEGSLQSHLSDEAVEPALFAWPEMPKLIASIGWEPRDETLSPLVQGRFDLVFDWYAAFVRWTLRCQVLRRFNAALLFFNDAEWEGARTSSLGIATQPVVDDEEFASVAWLLNGFAEYLPIAEHWADRRQPRSRSRTLRRSARGVDWRVATSLVAWRFGAVGVSGKPAYVLRREAECDALVRTVARGLLNDGPQSRVVTMETRGMEPRGPFDQ